MQASLDFRACLDRSTRILDLDATPGQRQANLQVVDFLVELGLDALTACFWKYISWDAQPCASNMGAYSPVGDFSGIGLALAKLLF